MIGGASLHRSCEPQSKSDTTDSLSVERRVGVYTAIRLYILIVGRAIRDADYAAKRADYFAAGTQVVWDVNPRTRTIAKFVSPSPDTATIFHTGDMADAEPVLPGWRVAVDDLFR